MAHTLIIGGTRGSGRALARSLAAAGNKVSVIGRTLPPEARKKKRGVAYWSADLADPKNVQRVLAEVLKKNGRITHLVFFQRFRGEGDDWKGEITISLAATKQIIESLVRSFDTSAERSIVVIGSLAGELIAAEQPLSYHVGKAGLAQMVKYYAVSLGEQGIRVNSVIPGTVLKEESKAFYLKNKKLYQFYKSIIPLGRMGTSEDIVEVVKFFCSKAALFLTGQSLVVDGGLSLQLQESLARSVSTFAHPKTSKKISKRKKR